MKTASIRKIKDQYGRKQSFSINNLKNSNRKNIRNYLDQRLEVVGQGTSRRVYILNSRKVIKLATNDAGIEQNKLEYEVANSKFSPLVTRIYDNHPQYYWIIADLVRPISSHVLDPIHSSYNELYTDELDNERTDFGKDYIDYSKITDERFQDVETALDYNKDQIKDFIKRRNFSKEEKDKLLLLNEFKNTFSISIGDLFHLYHWGKTPDGRVVILDYGLNTNIYNNFYDYKNVNDEDNDYNDYESTTNYENNSSWERPEELKHLLNRKAELRINLLKEAIRRKKIIKDNKIIKLPFSIGEFKKFDHYEEVYDYLIERLEYVGEGSSRIVFIYNNKYVIKIAKNIEGIEQNKFEFELSQDYEINEFVAKVEEVGKSFIWIMSEIVRPLNSQDEFEENVPSNIFESFVFKLTSKYKVSDSFDDFIKYDHWGKTTDGRYVLLDYGINDDIFNTYYFL